jgi:uncharacterized membrane protein YvlD (DUF360 family)
MHWLARIALVVAGNAGAIWLANRFVPGFAFNGNGFDLVLIALVLALLNFFLKPALTLILGPVIVLTLGAGIIIVNAIIIGILPWVADHIDFLRGSIMIQQQSYVVTLLLATLIVSVMNFVIHLID